VKRREPDTKKKSRSGVHPKQSKNRGPTPEINNSSSKLQAVQTSTTRTRRKEETEPEEIN